MKLSAKDIRNISTYLFYIFLVFIVIYAIAYYIIITPMFKAHELQTKEWISELTDNIVLGVNDRTRFSQINRKCDFISFWYCYWFFQTKKYTAWILFNLKNKFDDEIALNVYLYDFYSNTKTLETVSLKFSDVKTSKVGNTLIIKCGNNYKQEMDFVKNRSTIAIQTNKINMKFELYIDDYTTNQTSFLPRYKFLNNFINTEGATTNTPGDWMSDNPYIGKIVSGRINNDAIEKDGDFWFDNFIGCNNNFLEPYIWFMIMNDDWLIYLLWFDVYDKRNDIGTTKPVLIKNRKTNKFIYSGTTGIDCRKTPFPLNHLNSMLQPFKMNYDSNKKLGVEKYDDYNVSFKSSLINIDITSMKNKSNEVFKFNYYKNKNTDALIPQMNAWDKQYYQIMSNIVYIEYVNIVNVKLEYQGRIETFEARQIIDAMYPEDESIPTTIQ